MACDRNSAVANVVKEFLAPGRAQRVPYGGSGAAGRSLKSNQVDVIKERNISVSEKESTKNCIVPLNVWAENPKSAEAVVWRVDTVRLLVEKGCEELLWRIAEATRELVNRESRRRREIYEGTGMIDVSLMGAYRDPIYAELKKVIGSRNFDEVLRFVSEQWQSFMELKEKRERGAAGMV